MGKKISHAATREFIWSLCFWNKGSPRCNYAEESYVFSTINCVCVNFTTWSDFLFFLSVFFFLWSKTPMAPCIPSHYLRSQNADMQLFPSVHETYFQSTSELPTHSRHMLVWMCLYEFWILKKALQYFSCEMLWDSVKWRELCKYSICFSSLSSEQQNLLYISERVSPSHINKNSGWETPWCTRLLFIEQLKI